MQNQETIENRKKLIQLIHIGKHKLCMDEYTYREFLKNATGKTSSTQMEFWQLQKVVGLLRLKGFSTPKTYKSKSKGNKQGYVKYIKNEQLPVSSNIAYKIRAIWINMYKDGLIKDGTDAGLNAFIRHQMRNTHSAQGDKVLVFSYEKLNDTQADLILKRLYAWRRRLRQEA